MTAAASNILDNFASHRVPQRAWSRVALWTLVTAIVVLGGGETYWRSQRLTPAALDSLSLWAFHRSQLGPTTSEVVLLGASRIQLGFDTELFRQTYPQYHLTQLALDGATPAATLRDLAGDANFRGLVLCSITAEGFCRERWNDQQSHVDYWRREFNDVQRFDLLAAAGCREHCVLLRPELSLKAILRGLATRQAVPPDACLEMHFDRSRYYDTTLIADLAAECERRVEVARAGYAEIEKSPASWQEDVQIVLGWVAQIESRGGRVVFIRYPTSGPLWELDEATFPRSEYWDRISQSTSAKTLHFADTETLWRYPLPDLSHLDQRDVTGYTADLLHELRRLGVLPEGRETAK